jgi:hypothetical protein
MDQLRDRTADDPVAGVKGLENRDGPQTVIGWPQTPSKSFYS